MEINVAGALTTQFGSKCVVFYIELANKDTMIHFGIMCRRTVERTRTKYPFIARNGVVYFYLTVEAVLNPRMEDPFIVRNCHTYIHVAAVGTELMLINCPDRCSFREQLIFEIEFCRLYCHCVVV